MGVVFPGFFVECADLLLVGMDSHVRKSSSSQASKYSSSVAETNTRFLDDYFSHRDDFDDEFDSKGITKRFVITSPIILTSDVLFKKSLYLY